MQVQDDWGEIKKKIVASLEEKGAVLPCPRCGKKDFAVLEGYNVMILQDGKAIRFGGKSVISVNIICSNCGFLWQHAINALDMGGEPENE